jgi:hypothetical protein
MLACCLLSEDAFISGLVTSGWSFLRDLRLILHKPFLSERGVLLSSRHDHDNTFRLGFASIKIPLWQIMGKGTQKRYKQAWEAAVYCHVKSYHLKHPICYIVLLFLIG